MLFALCLPVHTQEAAKVPNIGWLGARPVALATAPEGLRRELRALGYVEGKNIAFESRYADNKVERLPALADELIRLKVDVLVTPSTPEALTAKNATRTIPVVFINVADPLGPDWSKLWHNLVGTSPGSPTLRPSWQANGWSC